MIFGWYKHGFIEDPLLTQDEQKKLKKKLELGTRVIHAGQEPDPTTGAVMTPIYATSTYAQQSPGQA